MRSLVYAALAAWTMIQAPMGAMAGEPALDITIAGATRHFTRSELLGRQDIETIKAGKDVSYGTAMTYRAVPLQALLKGLVLPPGSVIEAVASDGFAAQLPIDLVSSTDQKTAMAWVAIEPADAPWPHLPGKTVSAGPFYLVWTGEKVDMIRGEQWPYQIVRLSSQDSPAVRWPQLSVDPALPANDAIRAGQALFVTQCMVCHKLNGAGSGEAGPDLNRPMNPVEYLTPSALHALIRNPASVRDWPGRMMQGFPPDQLSDHEIDVIVAYLQHMAGRRKTW
jgi:mono/diheme cytochrome c family protein